MLAKITGKDIKCALLDGPSYGVLYGGQAAKTTWVSLTLLIRT